MKVLIWTQYFSPENFHINVVAKSLHDQGIDVTILTGKPNYPEGKVYSGYSALGVQYDKYHGAELIRLPLIPRGKSCAIGMTFNYLSFILSGYVFAPYVLRGKEFDVIFVYAPSPLLQTLPAIYLSWLKAAPLVLWVQDVWPDALLATGFIRNKFLISVVEVAVRYIYRFSDLILIQSQSFRSSVEKFTRHTGKICFFPNSAETKKISVNQNSLIADDVIKNFSIVFAGNIGAAQSCETIVEAARLLKSFEEIKFYLIGSGSISDTINKTIQSSNLNNIVMTGQVSVDEMSLIYESSSVLLLTLKDEPSLSATIPNKLQSYLASGKPIIACANGESAKVVINARAGITCPAGDARLLADCVISLYKKSALERLEMGENGKKYFAEHFDLNKQVKKLIKYFEDVMVDVHR